MKISKEQLKQIIKEELQALAEGTNPKPHPAPMEEIKDPDHTPAQIAFVNFANPGKAYGSADPSTLYALQDFVDKRIPENHLEEWNNLMTGVWDEVRELMGMIK